ncbi:MAG TPA: antitoxin VapB family protein [archaeon]|nr:antitoxin VapB family protein [archaeon]
MTKVISLSDDAYNELTKLKKSGESFSEIVLELTKKEKKPLSYFFGKWAGPKEELDAMLKDIKETRKKTKMRDVEF